MKFKKSKITQFRVDKVENPCQFLIAAAFFQLKLKTAYLNIDSIGYKLDNVKPLIADLVKINK